MAQFIPFRAVRPPRDRAHLVGSRSYMNYSEQDLDDKLKGNPFTFLHIIKPELHDGVRTSFTVEERFDMVRSEYTYFKSESHLVKDEEDAFYLYRQTKGDDSFTGIIGGVAVKDYQSGHVKIHEATISRREVLFENYLRHTGFNAEPVLLTYEDRQAINSLVDSKVENRAEYEFYTTDKVKHELWLFRDEKNQKLINKEMSKLDAVYIADGHHRCASSALLSRNEEAEKHHPANYFMSLLIPQSSLKIYDYNRLVKGLYGMSDDEFLQRLNENFIVEKKEEVYKPSIIRNFSMYLSGSWYSLMVRPGKVENTILGRLDANILTELILEPLLGVGDLKADKRVDFLSGVDGMEGLQKKVDNHEFTMAFGLYPVQFDQLKEVADTNNIMPPKSTWIEPKLRSGITIYEIFE